jgi:hypothetical protein
MNPCDTFGHVYDDDYVCSFCNYKYTKEGDK